MIHGKHDVIVPIWHAKWIFMKTPEKYRYKCLFVVETEIEVEE